MRVWQRCKCKRRSKRRCKWQSRCKWRPKAKARDTQGARGLDQGPGERAGVQAWSKPWSACACGSKPCGSPGLVRCSPSAWSKPGPGASFQKGYKGRAHSDWRGRLTTGKPGKQGSRGDWPARVKGRLASKGQGAIGQQGSRGDWPARVKGRLASKGQGAIGHDWP